MQGQQVRPELSIARSNFCISAWPCNPLLFLIPHHFNILAIAAIHLTVEWNTLSKLLTGFRITDKVDDGFDNYKLPLLFIIILIPLLSNGADKFSQDHAIKKYV